MDFYSILFPSNKLEEIRTNPPSYFSDLNLNQIENGIFAGKEEYNLKSFFYTSPCSIEIIAYRQAIMKDIEHGKVIMIGLNQFAESMHKIRSKKDYIEKVEYQYHQESLFLRLVRDYCEATISLYNSLKVAEIKSVGLSAFRSYLTSYIESSYFLGLQSSIMAISDELAKVRYCIHIKDLTVQVRPYGGEEDFTREVNATFKRFNEKNQDNYLSSIPHSDDMNHVEAKIVAGVALLFPEVFTHLDTFYKENGHFQDATIIRFDREVQFYISYISYLEPLKQAGLSFCSPTMSESKAIYCSESFDLALAQNKKAESKEKVVTNNFYLENEERFFIVSGPNQGGKTTFARTLGQLHHLGGIGYPIPGSAAKLFLFDQIFTQFEKEEKVENLRSKLEDDLERIHLILEQATSQSIIILNEILASTTLNDAIFLSQEIMKKIASLDAVGVWVSFISELTTFNSHSVSMVSQVADSNLADRTYKIERQPADGLAYAIVLSRKYGLTYECLKKRLMA